MILNSIFIHGIWFKHIQRSVISCVTNKNNFQIFIDIVHTFDTKPNIYGRLAAKIILKLL